MTARTRRTDTAPAATGTDVVTRKGGGRRGRPDARQLPIAWAAPAVRTPRPSPKAEVEPEPAREPPASCRSRRGARRSRRRPWPRHRGRPPPRRPLVERLPWDFDTTFPPPLPEAVDAGVVDAADADGENLAALHEDVRRSRCGPPWTSWTWSWTPPGGRSTRPRAGRRGRTPPASGCGGYLAAGPGKRRPWFDVLAETYAVRVRGRGGRRVRPGRAGVARRRRGRGRPDVATPRGTAIAATDSLARAYDVVGPRGEIRRRRQRTGRRRRRQRLGRVRKPAQTAGAEACENNAYVDADDGVPRPPAAAGGRRTPAGSGTTGRGEPVDPGPDEVWAITDGPPPRRSSNRPARASRGRSPPTAGDERLRPRWPTRQVRTLTAEVQPYAEDFGTRRRRAAARVRPYGRFETEEEPASPAVKGR